MTAFSTRAGLWKYAPEDCPVYVIDPADVPISSYGRVVHIKEPATAGMRRFISAL